MFLYHPNLSYYNSLPGVLLQLYFTSLLTVKIIVADFLFVFVIYLVQGNPEVFSFGEELNYYSFFLLILFFVYLSALISYN